MELLFLCRAISIALGTMMSQSDKIQLIILHSCHNRNARLAVNKHIHRYKKWKLLSSNITTSSYIVKPFGEYLTIIYIHTMS